MNYSWDSKESIDSIIEDFANHSYNLRLVGIKCKTFVTVVGYLKHRIADGWQNDLKFHSLDTFIICPSTSSSHSLQFDVFIHVIQVPVIRCDVHVIAGG